MAYGSLVDMLNEEDSSDDSVAPWPGRWNVCYWCNYEFWEGFYISAPWNYIHGHALCDHCSCWLRRGGYPFQPAAQMRLIRDLRWFSPPEFDETLLWIIVELAYGWWEP